MAIFAVFGIGKFWKFNKTEGNKNKDKNAETEVNEAHNSKINHDVEKEQYEENEEYKKDKSEAKNLPHEFEITKRMKDVMRTFYTE